MWSNKLKSKRPIFYPYKLGSKSAKEISKAFGVWRVRGDGEFRNNFKRPIINWGNSQVPEWMKKWGDQTIINHPDNVAIACNKLLTFRKFAEHDVKCPEWTTDMDVVEAMLKEEVTCIARKTLTGKGGEGIVVFDHEIASIPHAPLYTKYFKKKHEYRVHVFNGKVIDFVIKKKEAGNDNVDTKIRNRGNGWVFCREGVILPECVRTESIKAVAALGLTFGAVDVGYNLLHNQPCVFEVNSAPGIEGTTLESYANAIKEFVNGI